MTTAKHTEWTVHGALAALERDIWRAHERRAQEVEAIEAMLSERLGLHREVAQLRMWWQDEAEDLVAWARAVRAVRAHVLEWLREGRLS